MIAVLGTVLVFSMTLVLAGLSAAFVNEIDRTITTTGVDEWAIATGATGPFNSSAVLPAGTLVAARHLPGVEAADPFVAIGATIPGETPKHVTMIGAVPGGVGSPKVDDGRAPQQQGEMAVGSRLGKDIGDTLQMGDKTFRVVGTVSGSGLYGGMPNVFLTLEDVQALTFGGAPLFTSIALRGDPQGRISNAAYRDDRRGQEGLAAVARLGSSDDQLRRGAALARRRVHRRVSDLPLRPRAGP